MGSDGEEQEFVPRPVSKLKSQLNQDQDFVPKKVVSSVKKFEIYFQTDFQEITCSFNDLNELVAQIRQAFKIGPKVAIRLQQWFEPYQDWLDMYTFTQVLDSSTSPSSCTKIRVILLNDEFKKHIQSELVTYLQNPLHFSQHLNNSLKHYLETKAQLPNHFEASIHFIQKQYSQKQLDKLQAEMQSLKRENEQLRSKLNEINELMESAKKQKNDCSIM